MKRKYNLNKNKLFRTIFICSSFFAISFVPVSYSFMIQNSISTNNDTFRINEEASRTKESRTTTIISSPNEKMNSTIVPIDNGELPKNVNELSTTATIVEYNSGASKNIDITKINSVSVTNYVRLNTWYLPHGAQITYVIGLPESDFGKKIYDLEQWGNSAVGSYSGYAKSGKLYVTAYSNMIYREGELLTDGNYKLDDIIIGGFNPITTFPGNNESPLFSWTYGLKLNTNTSNKTPLTESDFFLGAIKNQNSYELVGSINNSYVCSLPVLSDASNSNGRPQILSNLIIDSFGTSSGIPFNMDQINLKMGPYNTNGGIDIDNGYDICIPGTPYATATLDVAESLYSKVVKRDKWASSVKNYEVYKYFEFGAQSFDRNNINYEILGSNNLTGELRVRIKAVPVGNINSIYENEFIIKGFMDWIPFIIIIATSLGAIVFLVIAFILVAQTSENKRYKLIRKSM